MFAEDPSSLVSPCGDLCPFLMTSSRVDCIAGLCSCVGVYKEHDIQQEVCAGDAYGGGHPSCGQLAASSQP